MLLLHVILLVIAAICFLMAAVSQPARVQWQPLGLLFLVMDMLVRLGGL
jgi:hypothetical protein